MKDQSLARASRLLAAISLSIMVLTPVAFADDAVPAAADATPASPAAPATPAVARNPDVEARIKQLHDQLKLTASQEIQWGVVADTMRGNAATMIAQIKQRGDNAKNMSAIDDIKSLQSLTAAHADGLAKLAAAFEPLYSSMSADQKQNADQVFQRRAQETAKKHKQG